MSDGGRVVVNLATGLEDPERVTVALLVANAALAGGREVRMFLTKEAVRLAVPGVAEAVACEGCPPLPALVATFAEGGGRMMACPICVTGRRIPADGLVAHAEVGGATPLFAWMGDGAAVFSY